MNNIEREAFEKWYSQEGEYSGLPLERWCKEGDYVDEVVQSMWMAWQAARQAPASGEVEPVACGCVGGWVEDTKGVVWPCPNGCDKKLTDAPGCIYNGPCDYKSPVYTDPPAKVPEGQFMLPREFLIEYLELLEESNFKAIHKFVRKNAIEALLTTPTPATTPETEWVEWFGGDQPVPDGTVVELKLRGGYAGSYPAEKVDWKAAETSFDIISYRVVRPANTPPKEQ